MRRLTSLFVIPLFLAQLTPARADEPLYSLHEQATDKAEQALFIVGAAEQYRIETDPELVAANPEKLQIDLPDGRRLDVERLRFRVYGPTWMSWSGVVPADGASTRTRLGDVYVHLVYHGDHLSGVLNVGAERYQIGTTSGDEHRLVRLADSGGQGCALDALGRELVPPAAPPLGAAPLLNPDRPPTLVTKAVTRIDVMAVWPSAYSSLPLEEAKLPSFIQASLSLANDIFSNSVIPAEYNLVYSGRLTGAEQPPATGLLGGLVWLNGDPSNVTSLRDTHKADMVALFIPASWSATNACGIANLPETGNSMRGFAIDFDDRAFNVNRQGCGLNDFTLAHELGHNYGMRHDTENTTDPDHLFPNGRGHVFWYIGQQKASVMGCKRDPGDIFGAVCNRVPEFSAPFATWGGVPTPTGTSTRNNFWVGYSQVEDYAGFKN